MMEINRQFIAIGENTDISKLVDGDQAQNHDLLMAKVNLTNGMKFATLTARRVLFVIL